MSGPASDLPPEWFDPPGGPSEPSERRVPTWAWKAAGVILWLVVVAIGLLAGESLIGFGK